jgi:hypothetical protein
MNNNILIIDNHAELQIIEDQHPELCHAKLVLLSGNFSQDELKSYSKREFCYFDEIITIEDALFFSNEVSIIIWNWFLDNDNNDLSEINGCSLGSAFIYSLEIILNTSFKYLTAFRKLLDKNTIVYCSSRTEGMFLEVINFLSIEIGFCLNLIESNINVDAHTRGRRKVKVDVGGRYKDLAPIFKKTDFKQILLSSYFIKVQKILKRNNNEKCVLFMPAGKHEYYFKYIKTESKGHGFNWILPLTKLEDFSPLKHKNLFFYYFSSMGDKHFSKTDRLIEKLKKNIEFKIKSIDYQLMISIMDMHIFPYFQGALNYFNNSEKFLQEYKPNLIVLSSESHELFNLTGQAAKKNKIKTALLPHGIYGRGSSKYKIGRFKWIDYGFAFGNLDKDKFLLSGLDNENIFITRHPYFERFLPTPIKKLKIDYRKAILLPPDLDPRDGRDKIQNEFRFYKNVIRLLLSLNIEILGVKIRDESHFKTRSMQNFLIIDGVNIPVITHDVLFSDIVKEADIVIGPESTAILEAGLSGVDYFLYNPIVPKPLDKFQKSLYKYVNVAHTIIDLKKNIEEKKPYVSDYCVDELIDLTNEESGHSICLKIDSVIRSII